MSLHTEFKLHNEYDLNLRYRPTTPYIKICTKHHKITQP